MFRCARWRRWVPASTVHPTLREAIRFEAVHPSRLPCSAPADVRVFRYSSSEFDPVKSTLPSLSAVLCEHLETCRTGDAPRLRNEIRVCYPRARRVVEDEEAGRVTAA